MSKNPVFAAAKQMIPMDEGKLEKMYSIRVTDRLYAGIDQMTPEAKKVMLCEIRKLIARHVHMSTFREEDYL